ncbi:MAG: prenyltransferase/squalene oxidase repeat-containing protein, partial [Planctomycetota bacterium]
MKHNILLVIGLILIAGVIVVLSLVMKPMSTKNINQPKSPADIVIPPVVSRPLGDPVGQLQTPEPARSIKPDLEQAFDKGLSWLMQKQLPSGSFPDLEGKDDVAFTAMGLIIMGSSHLIIKSSDPTNQIVYLKYGEETTKALRYILSRSQENGSVMDPGKIPSFDIYKTSLAIVALKTIMPYRVEQDEIKKAVDKAVEYLQKSQYGPESSDKNMGGWGYKEGDTEKTPNPNLSTTSYVIDALYKAGLEKDSETYKRAVDFLMKIQDS